MDETLEETNDEYGKERARHLAREGNERTLKTSERLPTKLYTSDDSPTNMTNPSYSWVRNVHVIGVMNLDKYKCCINCSTKLVPDAEDLDLGPMVQCLDNGNKGLMVKLMLASGGDKHTLNAFGKIVESIADKPADEISTTTLLKAKPFKMIHIDGIIQSVSRKP